MTTEDRYLGKVSRSGGELKKWKLANLTPPPFENIHLWNTFLENLTCCLDALSFLLASLGAGDEGKNAGVCERGVWGNLLQKEGAGRPCVGVSCLK